MANLMASLIPMYPSVGSPSTYTVYQAIFRVLKLIRRRIGDHRRCQTAACDTDTEYVVRTERM